MKKLVVSIAMILGMFMVHGQDLPEIVPPSPEATSLAKFTDIPVSHHTGLPNISIPIYTIQENGISVPIGISYHARGVQVSELASRVGMGWSLNAGGAITRQARDGADDVVVGKVNTKTYIDSDYFTNFFDNTSEGANKRATLFNQMYDPAVGVVGEMKRVPFDFVPDQFMFNFLGYSGKFIFDQKSKEIIIQKYSDLKIEPIWTEPGENNRMIKAFKVTTPTGVVAFFGMNEAKTRKARDFNKNSASGYFNHNVEMQVNTSVDNSLGYSSWHLMEVISVTGEKISFYYEKEEPRYIRRSYDQLQNRLPSSYFSEANPEQYQIKEIQFSSGKVEFVKGAKREDINNAYTLEQIKVTNSNNQFIKGYKFIHEYSTSTDQNKGNHIARYLTMDQTGTKRLFLENIQKVDEDLVVENQYTFIYNDKNALPNRFSNSQDAWGYYNGANNGSFLSFFSYGTTNIDRSVNPVNAQKGLLTKVIYPTGGDAEYEYEKNIAVLPSYFKNTILYNNTNELKLKVRGLVKSLSAWKDTYYESESFEISSRKEGPVTSTITIAPGTNCDPLQPTVNCDYRVQLIGQNNSYVLNIGKHDNGAIQPGMYKIKVTPRNPSRENISVNSQDETFFETSFGVALQWWEPENFDEDLPEHIDVAGSRIKRITLNKGKVDEIIKEYEYKGRDNSSSGRVFSPPAYFHIRRGVNGLPITEDKHGAKPGSPLTYFQGNFIGYSNVKEYYIKSGVRTNVIEYDFTNFENGGEFYTKPYTLPTDNEWLRGGLIKTTYYEKVGNNYHPIKKVENQYRYDNIVSVIPRSVLDLNVGGYQKNNVTFKAKLAMFSPDFTFKPYYITSGTMDLHSTTETNYHDSGNVTTSTTHFYNYNNNYQIAGSEVVNSKGETLETENTYPEIGSRLYNENRIASPIETIISKKVGSNIDVLSAQKTIYADFLGNYLPSKVQTSKGESSLEDRIVYHNYDNQGNPVEVSKKDGTKIYYVWGYEKSQPIAKIENFTSLSSSQQSAINKAVTASNADIDAASEDSLRAKLTLLRNAFSSAQVTTFTYDPLIGVTSITDPRGEVIYYEYDNFNRLHFIKDASGNLIKEHRYNYKN